MLVYRLGNTRYSNELMGTGAKLFGGRWNNVGTACLYTAESRALALLEYTVNVNISDIPKILSFTVIEIPDTNILELDIQILPPNWKDFPAPSSTKIFGTNLLNTADKPIIKIPSTIVQQEYNYILNPEHSESQLFKIVNIEDFIFDTRIKS